MSDGLPDIAVILLSREKGKVIMSWPEAIAFSFLCLSLAIVGAVFFWRLLK
jgi:hypothetical protein